MRARVVWCAGLLLMGCPAFTASETSSQSSSTSMDDDPSGMTSTDSSATSSPNNTSTTSSPEASTTQNDDDDDSSDDDDDDSRGTANESSTGPTPPQSCGDQMRQPGEACDDGNDNELDGCTSVCEIGPLGLEFGTAMPTSLGGGGASPTNDATDECATGEVLVGLRGALTNDDWLGVIGGVCRPSGLTNRSPTSFQTSDPTTDLPTYGGFNDGGPWSTACGANEVIVAIRGRAGSVMDGLEMRCATVDIEGPLGNQELIVAPLDDWESYQGSPGGSPFDTLECPAGAVATGLRARTSSYVNQVALLCRELGLRYD